MSMNDKAIRSVKASMAIEGLEPTEKFSILFQAMFEGKITTEEAINILKEYYGVKL